MPASFTILSLSPRLPPKMASPRPYLHTFIRLPRSKAPAHIVIGNEASDLDSVASALGYAYLAKTTPPAIPVINIPRSHLHLRRDVLHALALADLTPGDLTFIDDMPQDPSSVTLVDHNALASHQSHLAKSVTAVIDHHADENLFPDTEPRVIAPVGSCATLVSEIGEADVDTARLLLCAILIDCGNMVPDGKGTPRDGDAVERLMPIAKWDEQERDTVYATLKAARRDITGFSVLDLLKKDMKVIEGGGKRVAVCTVGVSAWDLAKRGKGLSTIMSEFGDGLDVGCVIVMNSYGGRNGHRREICVLKNGLGEEIVERLMREDVLHLTNVNVNGADGLSCFQQGNTKASRKVVAPILKRVLGEVREVRR